MEEQVKVKVQPLTPEAFKPYGEVVELGLTAYPEFEPVENMGRMAVQIVRMQRSGGEVEEMATHFAYTQPIFALSGSLLVVVAPAPRRLPQMKDAEIDYARAAAFEVKPGQGVCLGKGVWHYIGGLHDKADMIHMTRRDPARQFEDTFADFVNFKQRDGRVIEVEP